MLGVIVNTCTVIIGSIAGLFAKNNIPEKISDSIMKAIGLCTIYIGISGALEGTNTLILIISVVIGSLIGEIINIDKAINKVASRVEKKFSKGNNTSVAQGFLTASLLFCIGSMTFVGSLQAGLNGNNDMLLTKSVLDLISSTVLSATLGIGVLCSSVFVLFFQGGLVLLSGVIAPLFSSYVISEITCVGSVLVIGLGFNILGITKLKCANFLPAIFIPIILCMFM